jgi:parallel beta-helix repeat protein
MNAKKLVRTAGVATTAAVAVLGFQSAATAGTPTTGYGHSTVYVSPPLLLPQLAVPSGDAVPCKHTTIHSIQQAVTTVGPGSTVVVCPGVYDEEVDITQTLTLRGLPGATIDASNQSYGVGIGAPHVTVTGLTVRNAGVGLAPTSGALADGIVTASLPRTVEDASPLLVAPGIGNYATITNNTVTGNLGAGIDVNSTRGSLIQNNHADGNGIGINVNTDLGVPVRDNKIIGNTANGNLNGCGIAVADHSGAGDIGNLIKNNVANGNGLPAGGAGILLAEPTSGGILKDNTFVGNSASGNGHSGFELHVHVPDAHVSGNSVVGNNFGINNGGGDDGDPDYTGIYLGSATPMSIVVKNNHVHDDINGIFQAGQVNAIRSGNTFTGVLHPFVCVPTYPTQL